MSNTNLPLHCQTSWGDECCHRLRNCCSCSTQSDPAQIIS